MASLLLKMLLLAKDSPVCRRIRCIICGTRYNLKSMTNSYINQRGKEENYSKMLMVCFNIEFAYYRDIKNEICDSCITSLRLSYEFRCKVELAHRRLYERKLPKECTAWTYNTDIKHISNKNPRNVLSKPSKKIANERQITVPNKDDDDPNGELFEFVIHTSEDEAKSLGEWSVSSGEIQRATQNKTALVVYDELPPDIPPLDPSDVECPICRSSFVTNSKLSAHYPKHFNSLLCDICGLKYLSANSLRTHIINQHGRYTKKCPPCQIEFNSRSEFFKHKAAVHNYKRTIKCLTCPMMFTDGNRRRRHRILVHGIRSTLIPCNMCERTFLSRFLMQKHIDTFHLRKKLFKCFYCEEAFGSWVSRSNHMIQHEECTQYLQCELCGKKLATKYKMKQHLEIHYNIKRFKCDLCDKAFRRRTKLTSHIKIHSKYNSLNKID